MGPIRRRERDPVRTAARYQIPRRSRRLVLVGYGTPCGHSSVPVLVQPRVLAEHVVATAMAAGPDPDLPRLHPTYRAGRPALALTGWLDAARHDCRD